MRVTEAEHHFDCDDGSGTPFKVAKSGLDSKTGVKLLAMARGGVVPGFADGGAVDMPNFTAYAPTLSQSPAVLPPTLAPSEMLPEASSVVPLALPPEKVKDFHVNADADINAQSQGVPQGAWATDQRNPLREQAASTASNSASYSEQKPLPVTPGTGAAPRRPAAPAGPDETEQITRQRIGAAETVAGAEREQARDKLAAQQQGEAARAAIAAKGAKDLAENQAQADAAFNAKVSGAVDPNRFWDSKSTGSKVAAAIGLFLGGLGAGLQNKGGPNVALTMLNKQVEDDIEAQKQAILDGKEEKKSRIAYYLQKGHSIESATTAAKADALDHTAALLAIAATKSADPIAQARAQEAVATIRADGQQTRAKAQTGADDHMLKQAQATHLYAQAGQERAKAGAARADAQVLAKLARGGAKDVAPEDVAAIAAGGKYHPVQTSGGWGLASSEKGAEKIRAAAQGGTELKRIAADMRAVRARLGRSFFGSPEAAALEAQGQAAMKDQRGLGALTASDKGLTEPLIKNVSAIFTTDANVETSIAALEKGIDRFQSAVEESNMFGGATATPVTGRKAGQR